MKATAKAPAAPVAPPVPTAVAAAPPAAVAPSLPLPAPSKKMGPQSASEDAAMPLLRSLLDEQGRAHQRLSRELAMVKGGSSLGDAAAVAELHTEIARLRRALDETRVAEQPAPLVIVPPGLTAPPKVETPDVRIHALEDRLSELGAALRLRDREAATALRNLEEARKGLVETTRELEAERAERAPMVLAHDTALANVAASLERERAEARRKADEQDKAHATAVMSLRTANAAELARVRKEGEAAAARLQKDMVEAKRAAENAAQRERRFGEETERRFSDLRAEVEAAKADADRMRGDVARLDAELETERGRVRAAEGDAERRVREAVAELSGRLAEAEARADSPVPPSLLDEVEEERRRRAQAEAEVVAVRLARDAAFAERTALADARQDLERRFAELTKASSRLSAQLEAERTARTADTEASERALAEALEASTKIELDAADVRDQRDKAISAFSDERDRSERLAAAMRAEEAAAGDERLKARIAEVRAEADATVAAAVRRANENETRMRNEMAATLSEAREQQRRVEREAFQAVGAADERLAEARQAVEVAQAAAKAERETRATAQREAERATAQATAAESRRAAFEAELAATRAREQSARAELAARLDEVANEKVGREAERADSMRRLLALEAEQVAKTAAAQSEREAAVAAASDAGFVRLREAQARWDEIVTGLRADRDRALAETRAAVEAGEASRNEALAAVTQSAEAAQRELAERHEARLAEVAQVHAAALADVQREVAARIAERDGLAADYELRRARDTAERTRWLDEATTRVKSDLEARAAAAEEVRVKSHQAEIAGLREAHAAEIDELSRRIAEITAAAERDAARHRESVEALTASRARDLARLTVEVDNARARVPELEAEAVALRTELTMARIQVDRETIVARSAREQLEREMKVLEKARAALEGVLGRVHRGDDSEPELLPLRDAQLEEHLLDAARLQVDREQLAAVVRRLDEDRVGPRRERDQRVADGDLRVVDLHEDALGHARDLEPRSVGGLRGR